MSDSLRIIASGPPARFPNVKLDAAARTRIGLFSIAIMQERLDRCQNLRDLPALPYSTRGPVYMPVFGKGRTQKSLKGAFGFTSGDIRKMRNRGNALIVGGRGPRAMTWAGSGIPIAGRTSKSLKFANWGEMKRALGRSGNRDLMLSGQMRGAIAIVQNTNNMVEIGFAREEVMPRALGNQQREAWFGMSPANLGQLDPVVTAEYRVLISS